MPVQPSDDYRATALAIAATLLPPDPKFPGVKDPLELARKQAETLGELAATILNKVGTRAQ